ncbi:PAS domain-containing protein [Hyalangium minutum]|uniref:Photoactive yellow protein n=1 Tax=Hyalangium minutum TaxID=394096 RepID=A0A085WA54_9BACT|nr:PAS domain-containing protein [Hyalangium minutum]KFE64567.1 photoactive yellow protein [Hyalangium minutum]
MAALPAASLSSSALGVNAQADDLLRQIDELTAGDMDTLPFGLIQLDRTGRILKFNQTEANLARINRDRQLGKNFFDEVAPCTKVKEFYGRFLQGLRERSLYETFGFVFKFDHGWRNVAITLFYSEKTDSVWVLISQTSVTPPPKAQR